jgi:hypothetical protein
MSRGRIAAEILPLLVFSLLFALQAAEKSPLVGTWEGTWDSVQGQTGSFVMTIEEQPDAQLAGKMTVSSGGTEMYSVAMKSLELNDTAFHGSYDSPDGQAEILIEGTLAESKLAGKWKVKIPDQDLIEAGNWQATKKPQ